jgi:Putative Flp pilus-assembly TadE/G-like
MRNAEYGSTRCWHQRRPESVAAPRTPAWSHPRENNSSVPDLHRFVRRRAPAQALLWLTLAVPLFVAMAGLAIDGGVLLSSHRELQSVADGAARAAATRLDMSRLRASGGTDVQLDPVLAEQAARIYADTALSSGAELWPAQPEVQVDIGPRRVHVWIHATLEPAFLRIVRIDQVPVEASAFADAQFGIRDGSGG